MSNFHHNSDAVIKTVERLIEKFLRARSERSLRKLYHDMENKCGYVMLSGDKELSAILREMVDEAKQAKNYM